jgi:HK97 family phage major capsid protein
MRSRALGVIELDPHLEDSQKETATARIKRSGDEESFMRVMRTASPEYEKEFKFYLRTGQPGQVMRAFSEGTNVSGGFMVPFHLDPSIILTNNGAINPMRELASQVMINVNAWHGVASDGINAEYVGEGVEVAEVTATFSQPTITVFKCDAYVPASMELLQDSNFQSEVPMLIQDAKDRFEANEFVLGAGGASAIEGLVTKLAGTTASRVAGTTNGVFGLVDVFNVVNALPPRYRPNSSWIGEQATYNLVRQFNTSAAPAGAFWADLNPGIPPLLLGRPAYQSSVMDSTLVSGSNDDILVLGDISACYKIVDRMGMDVIYNPLVLGSNRRPTGQVAWAAFWRVGGGVVNPNAARLLRV